MDGSRRRSFSIMHRFSRIADVLQDEQDSSLDVIGMDYGFHLIVSVAPAHSAHLPSNGAWALYRWQVNIPWPTLFNAVAAKFVLKAESRVGLWPLPDDSFSHPVGGIV